MPGLPGISAQAVIAPALMPGQNLSRLLMQARSRAFSPHWLEPWIHVASRFSCLTKACNTSADDEGSWLRIDRRIIDAFGKKTLSRDLAQSLSEIKYRNTFIVERLNSIPQRGFIPKPRVVAQPRTLGRQMREFPTLKALHTGGNG